MGESAEICQHVFTYNPRHAPCTELQECGNIHCDASFRCQGHVRKKHSNVFLAWCKSHKRPRMNTKTTPAPKRKRNAENTQALILLASRVVFTRDGYTAGVREVAIEAGVNVALVNRYFGSKEELFLKAVGDEFDFAPLLNGPRRQLGLRLADYALNKPKTAHDPILILLRSASHPVALALFRDLVDQRFVAPLAQWLGGKDARERATLIASELLGLAFLRDVVGSSASEDTTALHAHFAAAIQVHVSG
jgi:AcrR family transcriptional regulator